MSQIAELTNINKQSAERSAKNRTPDAAQRAQHPKHHGCVEASFEVLDNISTDLRIGLFAKPLKYETLVRFSNGRQSDDREPDAHGMAIKVLRVGGPKMIEGREHEEAQDFVLIDNETFFTGDPSLYLEANKALLGGYGKLVGIAEVVAKSIFRDPHL